MRISYWTKKSLLRTVCKNTGWYRGWTESPKCHQGILHPSGTNPSEKAIKGKADCIRINPGNIGKEERIKEVISDAKIKIIYDGANYELDNDVNSMKNVYGNNDLNIISNNKYGLQVTVNDRIATSETSVPTKQIGMALYEIKIIIPELVL